MGRIVVFGAGGKAGKMITDEAAQRGHSVTATVRDLSNVPAFAEGVNEITGDPTDIVSVRALAEDEDVFIVAVGGADKYSLAARGADSYRDARSDPRPGSANSAYGRELHTIDGARQSLLRSAGFPRSLSRSRLGASAGVGLLPR